MRCSSCHAKFRIMTFASGICLRSIGGSEMRLYNVYGSSPKSVISHDGSCLRSCSAAVVPAKPLPTMMYLRTSEFAKRTSTLRDSPDSARGFAVGGRLPTAETPCPMDVRLVQLLASFIAARSHYALARLEFAMRHPADPAPPVIDRLLEPSESALLAQWPNLERQLEAAVAFADPLERADRASASKDGAFRWLRQSLR